MAEFESIATSSSRKVVAVAFTCLVVPEMRSELVFAFISLSPVEKVYFN